MADDFSILRLDVDETAVRALLDALGVELPDAEPRGRDAADDPSGETTASRRRTGPRVGETPPPGAGDPIDPREAEPEQADDGRSTLLLAGAGATVLAVLAAVAALLYRRRSSGGDGLSVPGVDGDLSIPGIDGDSMPLGGDDRADDDPTESDNRDAPDRTESKMDTAPLIGMALLAVGTAIARAVQSERP